MSDYDDIARNIGEALAVFVGNAHEPPRDSNSDSITMTKYGFITGVIRTQRLMDWVEGLAISHRQSARVPNPLIAENEELKARVSQLEVQLAGCGVAALGWMTGANIASPGDYGYSASLGDIARLRERYDALLNTVREASKQLAHGAERETIRDMLGYAVKEQESTEGP